MDSLVELDREGIFGVGKSRNQLTLNIIWRDQDVVTHIKTARELNPRESYLRFAQSQLPYLLNWKAEITQRKSISIEGLQRVKNTIEMVEHDLNEAK